MATITISGEPLEAPLTFENVSVDEYIDANHWLLTQPQAEQLLIAWRDSDTEGADDLARAFHYSPCGVFVTALHDDHELTMSEWESAWGADMDAAYSTSQMPFDFEIEVTA
jgi:hypothetical protein